MGKSKINPIGEEDPPRKEVDKQKRRPITIVSYLSLQINTRTQRWSLEIFAQQYQNPV